MKKLTALVLSLSLVMALGTPAVAAEYTVKAGDTLSGIARQELGSEGRWKEIYEANKDIVKDPSLIYVGQKLNIPDGTGTTASPEADYLADARSYILAMYKDKAGKVLMDFDLIAAVRIGTSTYDIEWTTDAAPENVKIGAPVDNKVTVDVNENPGEEDLTFTLTATVRAGDQTKSVSFEYYVPGTPAKSGGPTFVDAPVVGSTYKYALTQANLGKVLYFAGAMNGSYLATTEDPTQAADVTIEEAEGGVYLSFVGAEGKQYIDIHVNDEGKTRVRLTAEPSVVFTWNEECKVYTANVGDTDNYLGTYNTYNTISPSAIKYIAGDNLSKIGVSQFPCGFCTVNYQINAIEGQPAVGTTALFYLTQANLGKTLFFDGTMNGSYLSTTEDPTKAAAVTVEEAEGGYRLSFMGAEGKQYIDIHVNDEGKTRVRLTAEPTAVFTWNEECGVFTANVGDADNYLGTYNTYNTISPSAIKYIAGDNLSKIGVSQFPCGFGTMAYTFTKAEGQPAAGTYKFALEQANLGKTLYFAGAMNGSYLATTEDAGAAADVTIEEAEGGFRFSIETAEGKQYIDIHVNDEGKTRVRLTAEPTAVFTWNEECGVFTANVGDADNYLGTYNTYNTISPSAIKYISGDNLSKIGVSQFPCFFGTAAPAM